jgi:hypothetical protein
MFRRRLAAAALVASAAALLAVPGVASGAQAGDQALVRVAHFAPGLLKGDVYVIYVNGRLQLKGVPFKTYRLRDLRPGDQIRVVRADRLAVRFEVESLASYPKQALPGGAVYGATTAPALRLITCAGTFDRARHSYRDNLVVSAVRVADGAGRAEAGR